MFTENRRAARAPFGETVFIGIGNKQIRCKGINLSTSGLLLHPPPGTVPGSEMRVGFCIPDTDIWLETEITLVRHQRGKLLESWAVCFGKIPAAFFEQLSSYVTSRRNAPVSRFPGELQHLLDLCGEARAEIERAR